MRPDQPATPVIVGAGDGSLLVMQRRVFNVLTALALLLCLATAAMWVRSYLNFDTVRYSRSVDEQGAQTFFDVGSRWGEVSLYRTRSRPVPTTTSTGLQAWTVPARVILKHPGAVRAMSNGPLGFGYGHVPETQLTSAGRTYRSTWTTLFVPYWALTVLFLLLPLTCCARWWREHRREQVGRCRVCGYDLRASPERCPECGAVVVEGLGRAAAA